MKFIKKVLNILGGMSYISLILYLAFVLLTYDLMLKIISACMFIGMIIVNTLFFKSRKNLGIKILISLIIFYMLNTFVYISYTRVRGYMFKREISQICDSKMNELLSKEEIENYNVTYNTEKIVIDDISKGAGLEGYIVFEDTYEKKNIKWCVTMSTIGTHMDHYVILYDGVRYYFN